MDTSIETVLVYGYGVMGRAVVRTFAEAGFRTFVKSRRTIPLEDLPRGVVALDQLPAAAPDLGPRMCITGLVQQKDISGLAIHAHAQRSIVPALHHDRRPNPMLQAMVSRGETGATAGRGFYDWTGCDVNAVRERSSARLGHLMRFLDESAQTDAPLPPARRGDDLVSG